MESRVNILNELREISPLVAQIQAINPYEVPQGYFEGFAKSMLSVVQADGEPAVLPALKETPYHVPHGYFEQLADTILGRIRANKAATAREELESLSPLLSKLDKRAPYSLPEGFFQELPGNMADGARAIEFVNEELENLSPLMNGLKYELAYEVPKGYFENLPDELLQKARMQQPAKLVSIKFRRRLMNYAAAAVIAGLMITAGWMYIDNKTDNPVVTVPSNIPDNVLQDYVDNQTIPIAETTVSNGGAEDMSEDDMREMLADISDAELQKYLEQSNTNTNLLTN